MIKQKRGENDDNINKSGFEGKTEHSWPVSSNFFVFYMDKLGIITWKHVFSDAEGG